MPATDYLLTDSDDKPIDLIPLTTKTLDDWLGQKDKSIKSWVEANDFSAKPGSKLLVPGKKGSLAQVLVGVSEEIGLWDFAALPSSLPTGTYKIKGRLKEAEANDIALAWALGTYRFDWYKESTQEFSSLVVPKSCDLAEVEALAGGIELTRDLINIPAGDMGPKELAQAARDLADECSATFSLIEDEALVEQNFKAIHLVGKGAAQDRRPCLIDLNWGDESHRKITLVGKGVCFDTGGLDIKPAAFMKLMKKDMGGAANVLGLAKAIMKAKLPVRLRVLVPAVENAVSEGAMRPLDIVEARNGKTIEIGHTDAEGRVILSDALVLACEDKPEMVLDFATLTGAARVALGTELPALFSNNDDLANAILKSGEETSDYLWRLPLWAPYRASIDGKTADLSNESAQPYGGAITAALFLQEFIDSEINWAHIDMMGWNTASKPGRPEGGEAFGLRAIFSMLKNGD